MEENKVLEFTTDLKSVPVVLTTGEDKAHYVLREFNGEARQAYMGGIFGVMDIQVDTDKIQAAGDDAEAAQKAVSVKNMKGAELIGMQTDLISLCLFKKDAEEPVEKAFVQTLPVKTIDGLYKACQELNALGSKAKAEVKNE